jgi:hypothetical protein
LLGLLSEPEPRRQIVRLGAFEAYRYQGLHPTGFGKSLTFYAVPGREITSIACFSGGTQAVLRECEGIASSLSIHGAKPVPLRPSPRYAVALTSALTALNDARRRGLADLRKAKTQPRQAAAISRMARGIALGTRRLRRAQVPTLVAIPHNAIVASTQQAAAAYRTLGSAASAGNRRRYDVARRLVRAREDRLEREVASLVPYGYAVR